MEQRRGAISLSRRIVELLLATVRVLSCKRGKKKVCFQYSEVNSGVQNQMVSRTIVPCSVRMPVTSYRLGSRIRISKAKPVLKRLWNTEKLLHTCWMVVQRTGCSHRRNYRKEERCCEKVKVRTITLNTL